MVQEGKGSLLMRGYFQILRCFRHGSSHEYCWRPAPGCNRMTRVDEQVLEGIKVSLYRFDKLGHIRAVENGILEVLSSLYGLSFSNQRGRMSYDSSVFSVERTAR